MGPFPDERLYQVPSFSKEMSAEIKGVLAIMHNHVDEITEMEATVRVLMLVLEVINRFSRRELSLQLQPTIKGHKTFTDILVLIVESQTPLLLIEVKNFGMSASLSNQQKPTAQVLREAHIVLNEYPVEKIPFILTNSKEWGIGEAEKVCSKFIRVTSNIVHRITWPIQDTSNPSVCGLLHHLETLLKSDCTD